MKSDNDKKEHVKDYYGRELQGMQDLKTGACSCSEELLHPSVKEIESEIDDEILAKFYGCGSPIPPALQGMTVLDLGCGYGPIALALAAGPAGIALFSYDALVAERPTLEAIRWGAP